jgi:hypothetical protein
MMAKQDANPPPWDDSMANGCSGVLDLGFTAECNQHDAEYHVGGTVEDKLVADGNFYDNMCNKSGFLGWLARHGLARTRYIGVRWITYNYPPGHPKRKTDIRVEAFNWLGPGPKEKG